MSITVKQKSPEQEAVFDLLKAVAHPVRFAILKLLNQKEEICVCDLQHKLEIEQAVISQQLKRLKSAGVVTATRKGRYCHYKLTNGNVKNLLFAVQNFKYYDE